MKLRCISKNRDQQHETKAKNITNNNKQKLCNREKKKKKVKTSPIHCFHKSHRNINNSGDKSKDSYMNRRNKSSKQQQLNQQHWKEEG